MFLLSISFEIFLYYWFFFPQNCQHNTGGDFCEECLSGFVGDASGGTPNDCQPAIGKKKMHSYGVVRDMSI